MKNPLLHNFTAKRELIIKLIEKFDLDSNKIVIKKVNDKRDNIQV